MNYQFVRKLLKSESCVGYILSKTELVDGLSSPVEKRVVLGAVGDGYLKLPRECLVSIDLSAVV